VFQTSPNPLPPSSSLPREGGRRRSALTETKILDATRQLLADGGVRALTVEGVAARAGVAKTTIYRRYRSKDDLALAVLIDMVKTVAAVPDLGDARAELIHFLRATLAILSQTLMGRVMQGLVSDMASDASLAAAFRDQVVRLRVQEVSSVITRGIQRGDLREDLDPELVHELLFGPLYYRLLLSGQPLEAPFADQIVDSVLHSLRTHPDR
jgi:AcrR family transcriptional regulator